MDRLSAGPPRTDWTLEEKLAWRSGKEPAAGTQPVAGG